jgi:hypothetical protein
VKARAVLYLGNKNAKENNHMAKTKIEKITNIEEQIAQLENQKKRLMQERRAEERKARTKRLIERGAMLESRIPRAAELANDQIGLFLDKTLLTPFSKRILADMTARSAEPESAIAEPGGGEADALPSGVNTAKAAG